MSVVPDGRSAQALSPRFGPISRRLFRRFFDPVSFPDEAVECLAEHARRGSLVYVMRSAGILYYLFFVWAFARRNLPVPAAVCGFPRLLHRILAFFVGLPARTGKEGVIRALEAGQSAMVFLRRPALFRSQGSPLEDPFPDIVALQRRIDRPIFVVPQILIFKRAPVRLRPGIRDVILGSAEVPGIFHTMVSFLANYRRSWVKVGLPIDVAKMIEREPDAPDAIVARKVRGSLAVGIARELRAVVGPPLKPAERMIEETLRDRALRAELAREARRSQKTLEELERQARKDLEEIAARYSPAVLDGANTVGRWVFSRLYDGFHVDEEGLRVAAERSKYAPLVLCPTHRSHMDYIAITHMMLERGMTPPLVAAGANLAFWPLGPFLRRSGAYFIRRSFRGDKVYTAVLSAYVRKLIRDGYTQEFYPEGGRTRTGRILEPKLGLLAMQVDAWLAGTRDDLYFVPIAIDYERLMEAETYARELAGGEKVRESLRGLVKTARVLTRRWGEIYLQVDEPISLREFCARLGIDPQRMTPPQKKALIRALGHRIAWGMGRVQTLTASALVASALLAGRREAEPIAALRERVHFLLRLADAKGRRMAPAARRALGGDLDPMIETTLRNFARDQLLEMEVLGGETYYHQRTTAAVGLAFYRNNISQHFAYESLLATALLSAPSLALSREALVEIAKALLHRLEGNVILPPEVDLAEGLEAAAHRLEAEGILVRDAEGWRALPEGAWALLLLRSYVRDIIEAHLIVVTAVERLAEEPMERKDVLRLCFETGRRLLAAGRVHCHESLSKVAFEQALTWLSKNDLLGTEEGKLVLRGRFEEKEARDAEAKALLELLRQP